MTFQELKDFLDEKANLYHHPRFIQTDPIQVPHQFERKEDIEIIGFLTATIAWGQRKSIIANAYKLVELLENRPFEFLTKKTEEDLEQIDPFVHRTFNHIDLKYFLRALRKIYLNHGGLEEAFSNGQNQLERIHNFHKLFLSFSAPERTSKHVSDPKTGSSAKRLNMFMRWMVRDNSSGIDFGLWTNIKTEELMLPLDVHTGNVGRQLGLLTRKQNDWKAVEEISSNLRKMDPRDPIKYDLALFGLGAFEGFTKTT